MFYIDVTKKVISSDLEIGLTVARPAKAKRKICLSFTLRIQTYSKWYQAPQL
ncbi:hypothetical protein [Enterococcus diestrammenae]|uniref:hypothetical protein n=1 Tax=Enterococcus diestrammenae TaxID=1155073 RepID=UPI00195B4140